YFCLTGRTPFSEGTVAQKLIWHQTRQPKPIRTLRTDVPEGLTAILERMMAKDPANRYQSPQAVMDALAPWTETPIGPPPDNEEPSPTRARGGGPGPRPGRRAAGRAPVGAAAAAAGKAVAGPPGGAAPRHAGAAPPAAAGTRRPARAAVRPPPRAGAA